jgi:hypothetical protein
LAVAKVAGERPNELTVLDVITGKKRSFRAPWVRDLGKLTQYCGITSQAASASGDFAVVFAANGKREDIVMYPRSDKKTSWRKAGTISSRLGPSGGVIARPKIVNWLADGRLVYAMLYYGPESTSLQRVELWTAKRDGFDQRKWLDLPGAAPPSYNKIGDAWVTVSASGKRIAFFRDDRLYVFDADELVSHGGLGRSGRKQPP